MINKDREVIIENKLHNNYEEGVFKIKKIIPGHSDEVPTTYILDNNHSYIEQDLAVNDLKGMKYSSDKVPLYTVLKQFRGAFIEIAKRSKLGHEKYAEFDSDWRNFERLPDADEEYGNAQLRHLLEYGEDTELEHYVATAWNALARLQVYLNGK